MSRPIEAAFQRALERLAAGESIEAVLQAFPEQQSELGDLLHLVRRMQMDLPQAQVREAQQRSQIRVLRHAQLVRESRPARTGTRRWIPRLANGFALMLVAVLAGAGLLFASAQSLPGDSLYSVKRAAEDLRLSFASSPQAKLVLALRYDERRAEEVMELLRRGRMVPVAFEGLVLEKAGARWDIAGIPVLITTTTDLRSVFVEGDVVQVRGETNPGGWVEAHLVRPAGFTLLGVVDELGPESIVIGGQRLTVLPSTLLESSVAVGSQVLAVARLESGYAIAISVTPVLGPSPTPRPTATPAPTAEGSGSNVPTPTKRAGDEDESVAEVRFGGQVQSMTGTRWRIAGRWVTVTQNTEFEGPLTVGAEVEVRAFRLDSGDLVAYRIESEEPDSEDESGGDEESSEEDDEDEIEFTGTVEAISEGIWTISGYQLIVDGDSDLEGAPQIGDQVDVRAERRSDGSLWAKKIEVDD